MYRCSWDAYAQTIADEWIVSQRLAELLTREKMTGFELRPIRHSASLGDDTIKDRKSVV